MGERPDKNQFAHSVSSDEGPSGVATQEEVHRLIQDLDASFSKKMEVLEALLKSSIPQTQPSSQAQAEKSQEKSKPKGGKTKPKRKSDLDDTLDVLDVSAPDLDTLEASLVTPTQDSEDENSDDEVDPLLDSIANELSSEEKLGDKIEEKLAKIIEGRFKSKLNPEVQKAKFEAYNRPENCESLVAPKVNSEIWNNLPQEAMKSDIKWQHIQRAVVKAATATARAAETLLAIQTKSKDLKDQVSSAVRNCTDSIALCGHASREISMKRRQGIKPHLNKQIARICDESVPITGQLFGDTLASTLKDVKEAEKIGANTRDHDLKRRFSGGPNRYHPYYQDKGRSAFLGRGRFTHNKRQWGHQRKSRGFRGRQSSSLNYSQ